MSKTIGIVGSRRRNDAADFAAVEKALLDILQPGDRLVSGGCPRGADSFAERLAKKLGLSITIHYPDWDGIGKSAGFVRNTYIAQESDVLIACVAADRLGGTEDTIRKFDFLGKANLILV